MRRYENLPSISVELQDGNLSLDRTPRGPVTLIIGTATDGPNATQYLATDSNVAANIFGADSPLIRRLSEAKLGGSRNILLYRIGGVSASVTELFGNTEDEEITSREANVESNTKYKVYIGPHPDSNVSTDTVLIIFENDTDHIVYSNAQGGEVNLNRFDIVDFDTTWAYRVGTPTAPVNLEDIVDSIREDDQYTNDGDATETSFGYNTLGGDNATVTSVEVDSIELEEGTDYDVVGGDTEYTYNDTGDGLNDTFTFNTVAGVNPVVSLVTVAGVAQVGGGTDYTVTGDDVVFEAGSIPGNGDAVVITYTTDDTVVFAVAPAVGVDNIVVDYSVSYVSATATYLDGADNIGASWKKLYELLEDAYQDLETTIATEVFVEKAILDAPNIADGSVAANKLEYFRKDESDGVFTYFWSTDKIHYKQGGTTTTAAGDADVDNNGQPIIAERYHEVNFAHQLGTWCHNITENDRFVLGQIGTSLPLTTSTSNVAKWLGTLPETNASGVVISNGTGLLGNKFMAGSSSRAPGFYLTDTGTVDGNVQVDSNSAPIDVGKYLSVVAGAIVTPNSPILGSTAAIVNGGAVYTGLVSTIVPGDSTTNKVVSGIALPFNIKKTKLDELVYAGYVVYADTPRGVSVVSGDLATAPTSDYDYISTSIIVASIVRQIRQRLQPFIGKGINQVLISAAETAVEDILQTAAVDGAITNYTFSVLQGDNPFSLRVPLKIVPVFELRQVDVSIALSYSV